MGPTHHPPQDRAQALAAGPRRPAPPLRPMQPEDEPAVMRLAGRSFPPTQAAFVRAAQEGLVIDGDAGLAAAVILRVLALPGGRRIGFVVWVMTDPEHRGQGHAARLVERGVARLAALGCDRILTEIEGHNTASQSVFRKLGFNTLGVGRQIAMLGLPGALWFRLRSGYTADTGHFLWMQHAPPPTSSEMVQRLGAWALNGFFALLALALGGGLLTAGVPQLPSAAQAGLLLAAVALVLGLREAAMRVAASARGLPVVFRAWDSGMGISAAIAILVGQLFPLPGSVYPGEPGWRHAEKRPVLGVVALAGVAAVALAVGAALWAAAAHPGTLAGAFSGSILFVGKPLLLFDTVMAFAPFQAFNARRIYECHRGLWAAAAALGLVLFLR
jgi:ribosomal protein S18 acetylase RimI-like enzyme